MKIWPEKCKLDLIKGVHMKKILKNQKGQGVMEYVIISSLVGIVCIAAVKGFGGEIKTRIAWMRTSITQNIDNQGR
jgi:Flp pilus assembly pilin Flp